MKRKIFVHHMLQKTGFKREHSITKCAKLDKAIKKYEILCDKLEKLKNATAAYHRCQLDLVKKRKKSLDKIKILTENSPLEPIISDSNEIDLGEPSYYGTYLYSGEMSNHYLKAYFDHVLKYICDWEIIAKERVSAGLSYLEGRRIEYDYYRNKDEAETKALENSILKGKVSIPSVKGNKIKDKLRASEVDYQVALKDNLSFINEATDKAWKDLFPVIMKMAQFENHFNVKQAQSFENLKESVIPRLRTVGTKHKLLNSRLALIAKTDPIRIYTGPKIEPEVNHTKKSPEKQNKRDTRSLNFPQIIADDDAVSDAGNLTLNTTQANVKACTKEMDVQLTRVHKWISTIPQSTDMLLKKHFSPSCTRSLTNIVDSSVDKTKEDPKDLTLSQNENHSFLKVLPIGRSQACESLNYGYIGNLVSSLRNNDKREEEERYDIDLKYNDKRDEEERNDIDLKYKVASTYASDSDNLGKYSHKSRLFQHREYKMVKMIKKLERKSLNEQQLGEDTAVE